MESWPSMLVRSTVALIVLTTGLLPAQIAVRGGKVWTLSGPPIDDGVVLVREGRIAAVGKAGAVSIPEGFRVLEAAVVTPGLIDAHSVVGLAGQLNQTQDQDQIERSDALQPELRALDAYNGRDRLVGWLRGFGITTVHTGHAPGELISGQTIVVKTDARTVSAGLVDELACIAATIGPGAEKKGEGSPGTRGKMLAMLRAEFVRAQEYTRKRRSPDVDKRPARDLGLDALVILLEKRAPLLVTAHRAQDIASALRLSREFDLGLILDGGAEAYLMVDELVQAGVPVILHPPMARTTGELENASFESAKALVDAGIPVALQSGFESYVPKTRVVLFEAAIAAANGLTFEEALATITRDAARILGIDSRVGTLAVGKDGDLALFDGDPFEYTTHCTATVIEGRVVSEGERN